MDKNLEELKKQYDVVERYDDNFIRVGKGNLYGIVDKFNNIVIPLEYDSKIIPIGNGFEVQQNGKLGIVSLEGNKILDCEYDYFRYKHGCYIVKKDNVPGVVKFDAGCKQEILFQDAEDISNLGTYPTWNDNLFCVKKNGKWGYVDNQSREVIQCKYDYSALSDINEMIDDVMHILGSVGYYDEFDESNIQEYANDENFYRVLMYSLKNRQDIAFGSKNKKSVDDFIKNAEHKTYMIIESIKQIKTESKASEKGLGYLQEFYDKNLKSDEIQL